MEAEFDPKPLRMTLQHFFAFEKQVSGKLCGHERPLAPALCPYFSGTSDISQAAAIFPILKVLLSHPDLFDLLKA